MANYLTYPIDYMYITQDYYDTYSHAGSSTGDPKDYPIDDASGGSNYFYCPCDEIKIMGFRGVGASQINGIFLESTSKVIFANGEEDYASIMVLHPTDSELNRLSVGQTFTRGQKIFMEGDDGRDQGFATGNHFHMSVNKGRISGQGWIQKSSTVVVLSTDGDPLKPEEAFIVDTNFTTVGQTLEINFIYKSDLNYSSISNNNNQPSSTSRTSSVVTLQKLSTPWKGVDISDSGLSISQLKSMGYDFLICRIGITGQTGQGAIESNMRKDNGFDRLYQEAKDANFPIGGYWFSCAVDAEGGKREAEKVYEYIKGKTFEMPIFIDVEDDEEYGDGLQERASSENIAAAIQSFCDTLANKSEHYLTGVYIGYHFKYDGFIEDYSLDTKYVYWLPQWPNNSGIAHTGGSNDYYDWGVKVGLWQCDGDIKVGGGDDVDNDYCYYDYPSYIKALGYNGYTGTGATPGGSETVVTVITKKYYIRVVDTAKDLKEFTNLTDAINYAQEYNKNKTENAKYYVYNEDGTIAYPENTKFYTITMASTLQYNDSGTKKALLSNAISIANQFLIKFPNKNFYVFNSNKQAVYVASNTEKLYVVRKNPNNLIELTEGTMGSENTQIYQSWNEGTPWKHWIKLEEKQPNTYAVFQVTGENQGIVIYPKEYPYAIYKNNMPLNNIENNPSKNLKTAITTCCNLGFPHEVRNENTKTIVFQISFDSFAIGDIIKFNKNRTISGVNYEAEYQIVNIDTGLQTITVINTNNPSEEIECLLSDIYPLYSSLIGDKNFFINVFYTKLKRKRGDNIEVTNASPIVGFGDIMKIESAEQTRDNNNNIIYYLKGKIKSPSIQEDFSVENYYIESSYVTKLIQ